MISPLHTRNGTSEAISNRKHTKNLLMGEAHDVHGIHGLLEVVFVLLARDGDVTVGQETIVVESFQKQVRCGPKSGKTFRSMVRIQERIQVD